MAFEDPAVNMLRGKNSPLTVLYDGTNAYSYRPKNKKLYLATFPKQHRNYTSRQIKYLTNYVAIINVCVMPSIF